MTTIKLSISGMHCESCAKLVKMKLSKVPGVALVEVDYPQAKVEVSFDAAQTNTQNLINLVATLGYQAQETK